MIAEVVFERNGRAATEINIPKDFLPFNSPLPNLKFKPIKEQDDMGMWI